MSDEDVRGILLAGLGGQGVVLAGRILGHAAVLDGFYAAGSNSYGAQVRGSSCVAEVLISPKPIDYPHIDVADVVVGMSEVGYKACRHRVRPGAYVLYDSGLVEPSPSGAPEKGFDAAAVAVAELGSGQVANLVWVGIVAGSTGWFGDRALETAVAYCVPDRFVELNLRALSRGLELGRSYRPACVGTNE